MQTLELQFLGFSAAHRHDTTAAQSTWKHTQLAGGFIVKRPRVDRPKSYPPGNVRGKAALNIYMISKNICHDHAAAPPNLYIVDLQLMPIRPHSLGPPCMEDPQNSPFAAGQLIEPAVIGADHSRSSRQKHPKDRQHPNPDRPIRPLDLPTKALRYRPPAQAFDLRR